MLRLNRDILYLILKELQNERKTFYSCLLVNKNWNEIIIPILWKNPWKYLKPGKEKLLLNVIISHLSDELRDSLSLDKSYKRPLFDYISFCRHLNLSQIKKAIHLNCIISNIPIITNEILNLFINENTKFTHLYMPCQFDHQIHLIPGSEHCLSKLEFLQCSTSMKDSVLDGLLELCKSIQILELYIEQDNDNHGIVKLIEIPKKLYDVRFVTSKIDRLDNVVESFFEILENSLIKRANTFRYLKIIKQPVTKFLSSLENLESLELDAGYNFQVEWNCLENLYLPFLQILKATRVPLEALTNFIKNTNGSLTEINLDYRSIHDIDNKKIIQAIYQKCPNLKFLKLEVLYNNLLVFENLLINCKYLNGLVITAGLPSILIEYNWNKLFQILIKSSPTGLFKFKICSPYLFNELKSLELFFVNWKGRHPMLLQIIPGTEYSLLNYEFIDLIKEYIEEGIVKKFDNDPIGCNFEVFEWIQRNI